MPEPVDREALREEAAAWFARMKGPEAPQSRFAFEAWRRADPAHSDAYRSIEQTWRDSALVAHTDLGRTRSLHRVRAPFHGVPPWQKVAAGFATLGLTLALAFFLIRTLIAPVPPSQFVNAVGAPRSLRLADGSEVTLDTDSEIAANLGGPRRLVRVVRGRVRFDVAHDPAHPFVVDAGAGEVVARGTLFDVDLTRPAMAVTLYRGAVDVSLGSIDGRSAVTRRLVPGQRIVQRASPSEPGPAVIAAPAGQDRWVSGMLSFDDTPLIDVAAQANRYSAHHIHVAPGAANLELTGTFPSNDNEDLARSLAAAFGIPFTARADGDWDIGAD